MTEAGWTSQRPNREGVYWFRWSVSSRPLIVSVVKDDCAWRVLEMGNQYDGSLAGYSDGEWLGPLSPTDRQQGRVAGLREYREVVARELQLDHNNHPTRFKASIIEALDKADFEVAKIAQPAQDEKGVGDGKESNVHL